ncbi:MAG: N-acetylmuramoyl-L-alanine amidase-like domain-containing protein, partial [Bdellovibrionota bacterium]
MAKAKTTKSKVRKAAPKKKTTVRRKVAKARVVARKKGGARKASQTLIFGTVGKLTKLWQSYLAVAIIAAFAGSVYFAVQKKSITDNGGMTVAETAINESRAPAATQTGSMAPEGPNAVVEKTTTKTSAPTGVLKEEFQKTSTMKMSDRISFWSTYVMQNGGKLMALGMGHNIDDFAPIVPKTFDCTTFVETVSALSRSNQGAEFFRNLMAIRYKDSQTTFASRNHFPEIDWLPNNEKAGIIKDITDDIAQAASLTSQVGTKPINRASWLAAQIQSRKFNRTLASVAENSTWKQTITAQVKYLSVKDFKKVMKQIPSGTVVNFVHRGSENSPVLI